MELNLDSIRLVNLFENFTGVKVKDCLIKPDLIIFIVEENKVGQAIGKGGSKIKHLEGALKKKLRIIEYSPDKIKFLSNILSPLKELDITSNGDVLCIKTPNSFIKGKVYGRGRDNLKEVKEIFKRFFDVEDIKVI